ncbi:MAG: tetratricopeptide repeat protein, partial [Planctomycetota bacterium]
FQFPKSPRLVFLKGKALEKLGKLQEAIQAFSQAYKLEPSFLEPLFARAEVYHSLKDYDHSLEDYTAIIQKNPKFFHAYLGRAEVLCEKGRGEEALLDIQKLLQMNKDFGKVYYLRGRAKLSMGFLEQALLDFQRAEEKGFSSMAMKFYKGKCLLSLGEEQSALQLFEELFNQKTPFKLKAARTWAKYLLQKGEYAKSIPPLLWVEKHSSSSEGIRLLSQAYFRMGHMKEFLEWMEKLPLEKLKDKEKLQMAIIYFLEGKNNKGVQILQHLRGEDFQIWKPFMLVFVVGDLSQAMRELSILLHKRPKWGDLYGLRGVIYYKKGEFYKALQEFNFAKDLRAKLPFTYAYRGICNLVLEKWKESREDFERATTLSLDPRTPWGKLFRQGTVKFKQRLPYMATRFFELALLYNPVFAKAYYHLGQTLLCLIQVKKPLGELWIKCKASFLKAHKFDPYFEPNYLKLALVYLVEEKKESWTDLLKKIRSLGLSNKLQKIIKTLSKYGAKKDIKILVSLLQKEKESLSKTPLLLNILHFLIQ